MIYCSNCGKGIPDASKFCTFCGTPTPVINPENPNLATPSPLLNPEKPNVATPPPVFRQPVNISSTTPYTAVPQNEFYKNAGFWGAVLTLVGFFLPYVSTTEASFYYLVSDLAPDNPPLYMYLIFPVCAAIIILQGLTGALPKLLITIFKILPLLLLLLFALGISQKSSSFGFMGNDVKTIMSNIGIGLYMIVIGSILMLFFKTTKIR